MIIKSESFRDLLLRGTRLLKAGKHSKALPLLERAYERNPQDVDAALNLSGAYILSGAFTEAISVLEDLREQAPENPMVWTNLGAAYLGNPVLATDEQQRKAIKAFRQAYKLDAETPNVAYNTGLIYRDRQEKDEAVKWFRRALETNPDDEDARKILQRLLKEEDQLK